MKGMLKLLYDMIFPLRYASSHFVVLLVFVLYFFLTFICLYLYSVSILILKSTHVSFRKSNILILKMHVRINERHLCMIL